MANKIKLFRTMLGLSQHELAEKVGVTRATINSIENGKTIPSLKLANNIAVVLGRSINDVFHTLN